MPLCSVKRVRTHVIQRHSIAMEEDDTTICWPEKYMTSLNWSALTSASMAGGSSLPVSRGH